MTDLEAVFSLAQRWRERRAWAESLLIESLGLDDIRDIFSLGRAVDTGILGTDWRYKTHGIGVSVHRSPGPTDGIDFDLDKQEPDAWRLQDFARRQVESGALDRECYERIFSDLHRLEPLLREALLTQSRDEEDSQT